MDIREYRFEDLRRMSTQEVQQEVYKLLKSFDAVCRRHGLRYTLSGGTCLGAVRHNGFIPWDDDIDIDMPYPDFVRFLNIFPREKEANDIWMLYGMSRNCGNAWMKFSKPDTLVKNPMRDKAHSNSLWIDVLPIFALSDDEQEAWEQLKTIRREIERAGLFLKPPVGTEHGIRAWVGRKLLGNLRLALCMRRIRKTMERYPFGSTKWVHSAFVYQNEHEHVRKFPTELWYHLTTHRFEQDDFSIMEDTDTYLRTLYGPDYMTPPPPEQQVGHEVEVYCKP